MFLLERMTYKAAFHIGYGVGFIKALAIICRLMVKVAGSQDTAKETAAILKVLDQIG